MIGIVVDGFGESHAPILQFIHDAKPQFCVILNEKEKLANPASSLTEVCFRWKGTPGWENDDDLFNDPDFDGYGYAHWLAAGLAPGVGLYGGNEPGYSLRLIENTCDFMQGCIDLGRPGYLFNFAVFHPPDQFFEDITHHARFNNLYSRGVFFICGHEYFPSSVAQGLQDGAILRPLWFNLAARYRVRFTEWGYARNYDPHAGHVGNMGEAEYISQLEIYVRNPDRQRHGFPFTVFMWNVWNGFEIKNSEDFKRAIIRLNAESGGEEMYRLTHKPGITNFHVRTGKGTQFPSLGVINLDTTDVELLSFAADGYYEINVPSRNIRGWIYQSGNPNLGALGFRRV